MISGGDPTFPRGWKVKMAATVSDLATEYSLDDAAVKRLKVPLYLFLLFLLHLPWWLTHIVFFIFIFIFTQFNFYFYFYFYFYF